MPGNSRQEPVGGPSGARYRVYVVALGDFPGVTRQPVVYVGSTKKSARQRFRDHKAGGFTAARRVYRYGTELLPKLFEHLPTFASREEAEAAEQAHRFALEELGYRVFGGSGGAMPRAQGH